MSCGYYLLTCIWIFHFSLFIFHLTCTNKTNVPADLQSAGIEYKDFQSKRTGRYVVSMTDMSCDR